MCRFRFLVTIIILSTYICILSAWGISNEHYIPEIVIRAPWGKAPKGFGLIEEAEGVGPQSLCIDADLNIYVVDLVNRCVQKFDSAGHYISKIDFDIRAHDVTVDDTGNVYVLAPYDNIIKKYDVKGDWLTTYRIAKKIEQIDALIVRNADVVVRTAKQDEYLIATGKGTLNSRDQLNTVKKGISGMNGNLRYETFWINDHTGKFLVLDDKGEKLKEVLVSTKNSLGSIVFINSDRKGQLYLLLTTFDKDGYAQLKVLKYNQKGELMAAIKLPSRYFTYCYKKVVVDRYGNVYQLLTTEDGVTVIKWHIVNEK